MKKIIISLAIMVQSLLAVTITNDLPISEAGYLSVNVGNAGETRNVTITAKVGDNNTTRGIVYDYFTYLQVGQNVFRLSSKTNNTYTNGDNSVISEGEFTGSLGNTIEWKCISTIEPNSKIFRNDFSFKTQDGNGSLGEIKLYQYLDEDVFTTANIFFTRGDYCHSNLELFTINPGNSVGISHGGDYFTSENSHFLGWAMDRYNAMKGRIVSGNQQVLRSGFLYQTGKYNHPIYGETYGVWDIVSVLAWEVDENSTSAEITTTLGGVVYSGELNEQRVDLTAGGLKLQYLEDGSINVHTRIGNAGLKDFDKNSSVVFLLKDNNGTIKDKKEIIFTHLNKNSYLDFDVNMTDISNNDVLTVWVDEHNIIRELNERNNNLSLSLKTIVPYAKITTSTNKPKYINNEITHLQAQIQNLGKLDANLTSQLILEDMQGNLIESFDKHPLGILASNESRSISNKWNTTDTLAGTYRVRGLLTDSKGEVVDESNTTFEIAHKGMVATIDLMLDKAIYHTSDNIMMDNFIQSLSSNSMIENSVVVIEIIDSNQTIVYSQTLTLNTLLPLSQREADDSYAYSLLNVGDYTVKATLKGNNNTTFDTDTKTFKVQENLAMGLKGSVKLAWNTAHTGTTQTCNYSLTQFGSTYLDPQDYTLRIVDMSDGSIKKSYNNNVSLESLQTYNAKHNFSTHGFKKKLFSCGLYVRVNDTWTLLDHKLFRLKNTTPIAQNDNIVTDENTKVIIDVLENDSDEEGALDSTTLTIVKSAKHGSVAVVNGKVQYTPQINYSGKDTFYYRVKDSEGLISNVARVDIVINNSNEAPKAENQKLTTVINRHLDIMLTGNDPDGDALKYRIMSHPKHGTLSDMLPNVLYVPNIDYIGNDYFTFKVNDGVADSNIAIVRIGIKKESASPSVGTCTCGCGCTQTPSLANLSVPTGLKISSITGNSAVLSWNDNSDNELFFVVYINGKAVTVEDADTTSYTMENLDPETRYVVHIKVYGENGSLDSKKLLFKTGNFAWLPAIYNILNKAGE